MDEICNDPPRSGLDCAEDLGGVPTIGATIADFKATGCADFKRADCELDLGGVTALTTADETCRPQSALDRGGVRALGTATTGGGVRDRCSSATTGGGVRDRCSSATAGPGSTRSTRGVSMGTVSPLGGVRPRLALLERRGRTGSTPSVLVLLERKGRAVLQICLGRVCMGGDRLDTASPSLGAAPSNPCLSRSRVRDMLTPLKPRPEMVRAAITPVTSSSSVLSCSSSPLT